MLRLAALAAAAAVGAAQLPGAYFGNGISQGRTSQSEQVVFAHQLSPGASWGTLTHWWITGGRTIDNVVIRIYVDGESEASIKFNPPMAAGTGFNDDQGAWSNSVFGKGSADGGWHSEFRVPFASSINVTIQAGAGQGDDVYYMIVRGGENIPITVAGVPVPLPGSRLALQVNTLTNMAPLQFLSVANVAPGASGGGLLLSHTLSFAAPNLNTLEGCYHLMTAQQPTFPGIIVSTGTEDFFTSAYYFSGCNSNPPCRFDTMGLTHWTVNSSIAQVSVYRNFITDVFPFTGSGGLNLTWRNGDVTDPATGLKCTSQTGNTVGSPGPANVTTYSWLYTFPA